VNWSIIEGDAETGVTTFFLRKSVDTGNIITMDRTPIGPDENASELLERLAQIGAGTVERTLRMIASGTVTPETQDERLATRAPKLTRENTRIDWNQPARRLHDFIRGLALKPTAWTTLAGKSLKISKAKPSAAGMPPEAPGTLRVGDGHLYVACSDGWLELLELQAEGKKAMEAQAFARGLRFGDEPLRLE
ncbi:MAG: methionyl-tRNA formyltransferase, partial [Chlorobiaceae bacterium]|nr:methionyl-tRNA formyltransferase [Chlorobiaceae bacterium]